MSQLPMSSPVARAEGQPPVAVLRPPSSGSRAPAPSARPAVLRVPLALWRAMTANRKVAAGSSIVGFFLLISLLEPVLVRTDPDTYSHLTLQPPSSAHWLGTTQTGQDVLTQLIAGTQSSMFWGIATGAIVTLISVAVGLVGGYLGGWVDEVLSLLTNIFLVIPGLPLAIVLAAFLQRGPLTIALVISITGWAWGARVLRSQTLTMRSREFVTAARANGESTVRIIFFEILPNEISIVAVNFLFVVLNVILAWAALEFLGLGDISTVSWGSMLYWAQNNGALILGAWWWFVPPGLCIALVGAGLALINFGIDEIADPRLRQGTRPKSLRRKKAQVA